MVHGPMKGRSSWTSYSAAFDAVRPPRVILAEDDCEMRSMVAQVLRRDGYQVVEAEDGHQLEALIRSSSCAIPWGEPVDLVISDIRMPHRSGLSVLHSLRRRDWAVPVILITAYGNDETHEEARRLGAAAVFDKPFELDDLRTAVLNTVPPA